MKSLLILLLEFMRFGCFTFGGGLSIVAQMQQYYVEQKKSITPEDLLDLTSVAKSLPGVMICNVSMLYGYRVAGFLGGLLAVLGMSIPPMMVLLIVSFFYEAFRSNFWISAVMSGMQAAVVPIVISAAVGMARSSIKYPPCILVAGVCLMMYLFTSVNAAVLVVIGVVTGLLMGEYYERKEAREHGAS